MHPWSPSESWGQGARASLGPRDSSEAVPLGLEAGTSPVSSTDHRISKHRQGGCLLNERTEPCSHSAGK